ncbi:MAG: PEP-utilizing enzyme [Caldilineaceae bacterium]
MNGSWLQGVGWASEVVGRIVHIQAPVNGESYVVGPLQDIIFVNRYDRSCLSLLQRAGGLITVEGGLDSAGAIFAMDLGLPALIGAQGHIDELIDGAPVVLDTTNGQVSQWRKSMPIMRN